jgi:hypothetical protein
MEPVDHTRIRALLLHMEDTAHRGGWDGPANLWIVLNPTVFDEYRLSRLPADLGAPVRHAGYIAHRILPESLTNRGNAGHAAYQTMLTFRESPTTARARFGNADVVAAALGCEGWTTKSESPAGRAHARGVDLGRLRHRSDVTEMRVAKAVDITGYVHNAIRYRGAEPAYTSGPNGIGRPRPQSPVDPDAGPLPPIEDGETAGWAGAITEALYGIALAAAGLPLPERLYDKPFRWDGDFPEQDAQFFPRWFRRGVRRFGL